MKKTSLLLALTLVALSAYSQQKKDTVIVELAKTSQIIFTIEDRKDIEILKHYNFNELFENVFKKLEGKDSVASTVKIDSVRHNPNRQEGDNEEVYWTREDSDNDDDDRDYDYDYDYNYDWDVHVGKNHWGNTWQSFNIELGTNNYLENGKFPDAENQPYSVRPWGSWYVSMASVQRTRMGKKFFLEWGLGLSWYNFKFQEDNIRITKTETGVEFAPDANGYDSYDKSKLTASYVMATLIPVIDFGDSDSKPRMWEGYGKSFRFGIGPYVGYRIGSHSKLVYEDGDDREKDKERTNFYLNNFRYGARLQLGYRSTDLFFNYDINELFTTGKGPKLNAFSFGIIF